MRKVNICLHDLFAHLNSYKADKVIAIAEDATRVIARAEYDGETDKIVGFILPCDSNGLPLSNSFIATSFSAIEIMFKDNEICSQICICVYGPGPFKASSCLLSCLSGEK